MRTAKRVRKTAETAIELRLNLDQPDPVRIETGVGFFDHMLTLFARHGRFSLEVVVAGDLEVDAHHTVEDVGIVLGECLQEALGDKVGVVRYGTSFVPMDESLALVSLDLSGRAYLVFDATFTNPKLGQFDTELTQEFFQAFAYHGKVTLHEKILYGRNTHHQIEALFKATGRALREAVTLDPAIKGVNSTKGTLA